MFTVALLAHGGIRVPKSATGPVLATGHRACQTPELWRHTHATSNMARLQNRLARPMTGPAILAIAVSGPLTILGVVALLRARREDVPTIVEWLSRWGRR